jgi:hypothetical protein
LKLSNLISVQGCPELVKAAAKIRLGVAPLPGSIRVLEGEQVSARLRTIARELNQQIGLEIPERISVRRAGVRWSCTDVRKRVVGPSAAGECSMDGAIPGSASLAAVRKFWDPAARNWDLVVRCGRTTDCVPFLLRVRGTAPGSLNSDSLRGTAETRFANAHFPNNRESAEEPILVRPGDRATLVWDEDGIRLTLPSVCLEDGRRGQTIRARALRGGREVRAVVMDKGNLRLESQASR